MKYVLLLFTGFILIYAIWGYWRFRSLITVGEDIANRTTAFQLQNPSATMKILVVGDSTAVGVGADDPLRTIPGRIHTKYPQASLRNLGVSGAKVRDALVQLSSLDPVERYDVVLVQIGGNDIVRFTDLDELSGSIRDALVRAKEYSDRVVLMTAGNVGTAPIFPLPVGLLISKRTETVREIFLSTADDVGVSYVDLYTTRAEDPFLADVNRFYAADYFHPSADGYGIWWRTVEPVIEDAVK